MCMSCGTDSALSIVTSFAYDSIIGACTLSPHELWVSTHSPLLCTFICICCIYTISIPPTNMTLHIARTQQRYRAITHIRRARTRTIAQCLLERPLDTLANTMRHDSLERIQYHRDTTSQPDTEITGGTRKGRVKNC